MANAKEKKRKPNYTIRQTKLAYLLAQDIKPYVAGLEAGYSKNTCKSTIYDIVEKSEIKELVEDIRAKNRRVLDELGHGHAKRLQKMIALTEATKPLVLPDVGEVLYVADNPSQVAAAKELHKLAGDYPAEQHEVAYSGGVELISNLAHPIIDITPDD